MQYGSHHDIQSSAAGLFVEASYSLTLLCCFNGCVLYRGVENNTGLMAGCRFICHIPFTMTLRQVLPGLLLLKLCLQLLFVYINILHLCAVISLLWLSFLAVSMCGHASFTTPHKLQCNLVSFASLFNLPLRYCQVLLHARYLAPQWAAPPSQLVPPSPSYPCVSPVVLQQMPYQCPETPSRKHVRHSDNI